VKTKRSLVKYDCIKKRVKVDCGSNLILLRIRISSLLNKFACKLGSFQHERASLNAKETGVLKPHECHKESNLHTNELNRFFCSTSPLKAPNRLISLTLA
jgi:hypothetical protein